jgi:hypothetical protein
MKEEHTHERHDGDRWDYGKAYVRTATISDAAALGPNLRAADRNELAALTKQSPVSVIEDGINDSEYAYTVCLRDGDNPCAIFGVNDSGDTDLGIIWMLGTDDLFRIALKFLRNSKWWVNELHKKHKILFNVIDSRQTVYIKWLKWLGFRFVRTFEDYGLEKRRFLVFIRKND